MGVLPRRRVGLSTDLVLEVSDRTTGLMRGASRAPVLMHLVETREWKEAARCERQRELYGRGVELPEDAWLLDPRSFRAAPHRVAITHRLAKNERVGGVRTAQSRRPPLVELPIEWALTPVGRCRRAELGVGKAKVSRYTRATVHFAIKLEICSEDVVACLRCRCTIRARLTYGPSLIGLPCWMLQASRTEGFGLRFHPGDQLLQVLAGERHNTARRKRSAVAPWVARACWRRTARPTDSRPEAKWAARWICCPATEPAGQVVGATLDDRFVRLWENRSALG